MNGAFLSLLPLWRGTLLALAALSLFFFAGTALAQGENIAFPIPELGGCESKEQCKTYCDSPANTESCLAFAESHNLMSPEEAATARKFIGQTGPGGCRGSECRAYCSDFAHRDECTAFAREHGITPPPHPGPGPRANVDEPDIDEDRAIQIVEEFGGPGGCRTKNECHAYCEVATNMEACLAFAAEHDLMSADDLARARKMLTEGGPGGCRGRECQTYCEDPANSESCLQFAEEQGFIEHEEAEKARKFLNTTGPGGCRGRECQTYCEDSAHQNECFEFAVQNGFISEKEAARMREFMERGGPHDFRNGPPSGEGFEGEGSFEEFGGPGGCRGQEECSRYCSEHPGECRGFGPSSGTENGRDFGQDRAIDERGFEVPPGLPCSTPEECHRLYNETPERFRMMPPEGMAPSEEGFEQYREQYSEQYKEQYPEQYREQYQGTESQFQQYQQPPDGTTYPPPEEPTRTEPTSHNYPSRDLIATALSALAQFLGF